MLSFICLCFIQIFKPNAIIFSDLPSSIATFSHYLHRSDNQLIYQQCSDTANLIFSLFVPAHFPPQKMHGEKILLTMANSPLKATPSFEMFPPKMVLSCFPACDYFFTTSTKK